MTSKAWGMAAICAVALAGCAVGPQRSTPEEFAAAVEAKFDEYKQQTTFKGAPLTRSGLDTYNLRAWRDKSGHVTYQVYVMDAFAGAWRFYDSAFDAQGGRIDTTRIKQEIAYCSGGTCNYYEHVGLNVSREYLEGAIAGGMRFKLFGRGGEQAFVLPGAYIAGFLKATHQPGK